MEFQFKEMLVSLISEYSRLVRGINVPAAKLVTMQTAIATMIVFILPTSSILIFIYVADKAYLVAIRTDAGAAYIA
jgi:hypothetical protein